ncbi:hypothetical protein IMZ48_27665 [Candidatus Bathyarchaeota archaeon]|nr:hypothetical protein [Candidatus Bathyarchaeota archaeon]
MQTIAVAARRALAASPASVRDNPAAVDAVMQACAETAYELTLRPEVSSTLDISAPVRILTLI